MFKGIIAGLLLIIAPIIGVFLRIQGSNGYVIGTVVTVINLVVILGIGYFLKMTLYKKKKKIKKRLYLVKRKVRKKVIKKKLKLNLGLIINIFPNFFVLQINNINIRLYN